MKKRLYALLLVGVLTFNQAGMIVFAEDSGAAQQESVQFSSIGSVSVNKTSIEAQGGQVRFTLDDGGDFPSDYSIVDDKGIELKADIDYMEVSVNGSRMFLQIGANTSATARTLYLVINGEHVASVQQAGQSDVAASISGIEKSSQKKLADGRTQVVYKVSGSNLKEVGIKVKEGFNTTLKEGTYTVERSGAGTEQTVTITLPANNDEFDTTYTINFFGSTDSQTVEKSDKVTVSPAGQTTQASISGVSVDKAETEWNEGTVTASVKGTGLSSDLEVKVLDSANQDVKATVGKASGTETEQKFTVELPDNTATADKTYTISVNIKGQTETKQASVKVKGKDWKIEQKITDIVASQTEVSNDNRTVVFTLTGENLSANTAFKILKNQMREDLTQYHIQVEGKGTTQTVTITFPENTTGEDVNYAVNFYADGNTVGGIFKKFAVKGLKAQTSEAVVAGVTVDKPALTSKGGISTFDVAGSGLSGNVAVKVFKNGVEDTSLNPMFLTSTALAQQFTINFPENTTDKDVVYTVKAAPSAAAEASLWKETTVTVAAKEEVKEGKVTAITVTPDNVEKAGGKVQLKVTGTDLTADNWGIEVKTFISGTEVDRTTQFPAVVSDITSDGAIITIPVNGMVNELEYRVVAGALKDGKVQEQATATIKQNGGERKVDLVFANAYLADEKTVVAEFENEIAMIGTEDELKAKITLSGYQSAEGGLPGALGTSDSVNVEGKTLTISLGTEYKATATSQISIEAGALTVDGKAENRAATHTLSHKPVVQQINYVKDVFDYKGGTAVAKLSGIRVNELTEGSVEATIIDPGTLEKKEIEAVVKYGEEKTVEFTLPENTTDKTQSYLLSLKVNGQNVYEVDGTNLARRAIVSVLPKGVADDAQTISSITITGNNKLDLGNTNQITVTVEQQVGALKTVLRLAGTNLDSTKTAVRALDENGIVWPVYHIPECDGSWRFVAIDGINKNGVIGDGNSQFIELLPPRYAGTNKTYRIQVALDGEHFLEEPIAILTVNNEKVKGQEEEWVECGEEDIVNITAKYVDKKTGKEIAESDLYSGYQISMYDQFDIGAKEIKGYKLVNSPDMSQYNGHFYRDNPTNEFVFEYEAEDTENPVDPTPGEDTKPSNPTPSDDKKSDDKKSDDKKTNTGNKDQTKKNNTVKTGDTAPIFPYTVALAASVAGAATLIFKKKEDK